MKNKWFKFGLTNLMTLIRTLGIFALVPVFKLYGGIATFLLSAGCFATDFLDGMMARGFKCSTFFGSLFDGFSDKAFLIVNMILLMSITPLAIVPIILELGIASVQSIKYNHNMNVQSNKIGKAKMWVAGILISICYLLVDANFLNYLGSDLALKIANYDQIKLFSMVLSPLVFSEVLTLGSYIKEYMDELSETTPEKIENAKKEEEQILNKMNNTEIKNVLFDPDFYNEYKNRGNLRLVRSLTKKKK